MQGWIVLWLLVLYSEKHKIRWDDEYIPYTGIPFMVASFKTLYCHHGTKKDISAKRKWKDQSGKKLPIGAI